MGDSPGNTFKAFQCNSRKRLEKTPPEDASHPKKMKYGRFKYLQKSHYDQEETARQELPATGWLGDWHCGNLESYSLGVSSEQCAAVGGLVEKLGDVPLRLIIVGHNPSEHAWKSGHYYSNPSNRMWKILRESGIAPHSVLGPQDDDRMLSDAGVGFTDVGTGFPGTDSSQFGSSTFGDWTPGFFARLEGHLQKASKSIGCTCGKCGSPDLVVFAGKKHFIGVYNAVTSPKIKSVHIGRQNLVPKGWPFPETTQVWVLPSTSGASALTKKEREGPFYEIGAVLKEIRWPKLSTPSCTTQHEEQSAPDAL